MASANGLGALLLTLWVLLLAWDVQPAGVALILGVAGVLALLAVLEARAALHSA